MQLLKYFLMILGIALFGSSGALLAYDIYLSAQLRRLLGGGRGAANETHANLDLGRTGSSACDLTGTHRNLCPTWPPAKTPAGGSVRAAGMEKTPLVSAIALRSPSTKASTAALDRIVNQRLFSVPAPRTAPPGLRH